MINPFVNSFKVLLFTFFCVLCEPWYWLFTGSRDAYTFIFNLNLNSPDYDSNLFPAGARRENARRKEKRNGENAEARFASLRVSEQPYLHNNRGSRNRLCLLLLTCASVALSVGVAYRYSTYTRLGKSSDCLLLRESCYSSAERSKVSALVEERKKITIDSRNTMIFFSIHTQLTINF